MRIEIIDMAIHRRAHHEGRFTVFTNDLLNDTNLTMRAQGLLTYILSKPPNWKCEVEDIMRHFHCGRDYAYAALKEIEEAGYLCRVKARNGKGHWVHDQDVYDEPDPAKISPRLV